MHNNQALRPGALPSSGIGHGEWGSSSLPIPKAHPHAALLWF